MVGCFILAEKEGFEPSIPFWGIHDFQSCALGQLRDFSKSAARISLFMIHHLNGFVKRYFAIFLCFNGNGRRCSIFYRSFLRDGSLSATNAHRRGGRPARPISTNKDRTTRVQERKVLQTPTDNPPAALEGDCFQILQREWAFRIFRPFS